MSVLCVSCAFLFFALDGRGDGTRACFGWSMVMGLVCALDGFCFWLRVLAVLEIKLFCVNTFARRSELLVASVVSVLKLSCGLAMCLEMVQSSELLMGLLDLADISQIVIFCCSVLTDCMREAHRDWERDAGDMSTNCGNAFGLGFRITNFVWSRLDFDHCSAVSTRCHGQERQHRF